MADFRSIELLTDQGAEREWRRERLSRVLGYAVAQVGGIVNSVVSLEDHEGTLTVTWRSHGAHAAGGWAFHAAWSNVGEEPSDAVEHDLPD